MQLFNDAAVWQRFQYSTKQPLEWIVERVKIAALEHQLQQLSWLRVHPECIVVEAPSGYVCVSQRINLQNTDPLCLHHRSYFIPNFRVCTHRACVP